MRIRWQALKGNPEAAFLALDLAMVLLISVNLLWWLLDYVMMNTGTGVLIARYFPDIYLGYREHWHEQMIIYDTFFTLFLVSELAFRWAVAILRKTYYRWFFYPFIHWYDVLGIIPIPGFRVLRLLRLISILYRLHHMGVIDLAQGGLFQMAQKYYRIVLEEISDRVVLNVLDGIKHEVQDFSPVSHKLIDKAVLPRRDIIVDWLASRLGEVSRHAYVAHEQELESYLDRVVNEAFATNEDIQRLKRTLPVVGNRLEKELRTVVGGLLFDITGRILRDAGNPGNAAMHDVSQALFDTLSTPEEGVSEAARGILIDVIDLLKEQIAVQRWKVDESRHESPGPASAAPPPG